MRIASTASVRAGVWSCAWTSIELSNARFIEAERCRTLPAFVSARLDQLAGSDRLNHELTAEEQDSTAAALVSACAVEGERTYSKLAVKPGLAECLVATVPVAKSTTLSTSPPYTLPCWSQCSGPCHPPGLVRVE